VQVAPWLVILGMAAAWPKPVAKGGLSEDEVAPPADFAAKEPGRGRAAVTPQEIPARGWRDILWRTWLETGRDKVQIVAAGVTFYTLLAMFPALGAFVSLYGLFADVGEVEKQLYQLSNILPPGAVDLIGAQMLRLALSHGATLSVAFATGLVLSIWSANAAMRALFDGLNVAYDETEKRNWLKRTVITFGFTAGAVVFLALVTAILVGIPATMSRFGYTPMENVWLAVRWVVLMVIASLSFSVLYRFGPSRAQARWRWLTWGSLLAAIAWLLGSLAFSAYVNNIANFDRTYGPLGAVIGFMLWIWLSILIILLGAELNSEIEHQTAVDTTTGAPEPMGMRGAVMADTVGLAFNGINVAKLRSRAKQMWSSVRGERADEPR